MQPGAGLPPPHQDRTQPRGGPRLAHPSAQSHWTCPRGTGSAAKANSRKRLERVSRWLFRNTEGSRRGRSHARRGQKGIGGPEGADPQMGRGGHRQAGPDAQSGRRTDPAGLCWTPLPVGLGVSGTPPGVVLVRPPHVSSSREVLPGGCEPVLCGGHAVPLGGGSCGRCARGRRRGWPGPLEPDMLACLGTSGWPGTQGQGLVNWVGWFWPGPLVTPGHSGSGSRGATAAETAQRELCPGSPGEAPLRGWSSPCVGGPARGGGEGPPRSAGRAQIQGVPLPGGWRPVGIMTQGPGGREAHQGAAGPHPAPQPRERRGTHRAGHALTDPH